MFQKALIALLILPFGTAYAQADPVPTPVQDLVQASQCPANMACGTKPIIHLDPVYKLRPRYVTSEILHVERPVRSSISSVACVFRGSDTTNRGNRSIKYGRRATLRKSYLKL